MSAVHTRQTYACLRRCLNAPRLPRPPVSWHAYATTARNSSSTSSSTTAPKRVFRAASTSTTSTTPRTTTTTTNTATPTRSSTASASAPPTTARNSAAASPSTPIRDLEEGLSDNPLDLDQSDTSLDWSRSFHGLSSERFSEAAAAALLEPINADDIEIKPDGIIYLPEIKYRRILNRAFGPGGWGLAPRGETIVTGKTVTREYGLVAGGRLVSIARGEQQYFEPEGIPTATEGCKSNALMRCCKDLGVASELWDPRFIRRFMKEYAKKVWVEHVATKKKKQITIRKDDEIPYPWKESKFGA
ncbi:Mitochondrial genome maintenance protein MGM101 [Lasiodiplodia hormozganensis]|uniref:Mitochondrial genome maintenance protein MGM101 n=1 Tax=Lasiodiplodia hormozganensis TaxID=869390 RepID=A0AA39Z169_9PEZI|nr:Mitochondrial genome maintenance protein MGM101 [Lasiodiplodia hormozganensis]